MPRRATAAASVVAMFVRPGAPVGPHTATTGARAGPRREPVAELSPPTPPTGWAGSTLPSTSPGKRRSPVPAGSHPGPGSAASRPSPWARRSPGDPVAPRAPGSDGSDGCDGLDAPDGSGGPD